MRVWLDDLRPMPDGYTHWAKTADEAIALLQTGEVEEISLDHDLGKSQSDGYTAEAEQTGYTVARFIEEGAVKGTVKRMRLRIHSQNPVGVKNIKAALRVAMRAWMEGDNKEDKT